MIGITKFTERIKNIVNNYLIQSNTLLDHINRLITLVQPRNEATIKSRYVYAMIYLWLERSADFEVIELDKERHSWMLGEEITDELAIILRIPRIFYTEEDMRALDKLARIVYIYALNC